MKKIFIVPVLIFLFIFSGKSAAQETQYIAPAVAVTEIGVAEPSQTEWVEVCAAAPADLTGWKFFEEGANHSLNVFRGNFELQAQQCAIIANDAAAFAAKYPDFSGTILDSSWGSLKETGEEISLKNSNGEFLEKFTYPDLSLSQGEGVSIERIYINVAAAAIENWKRSASNSIGAFIQTEITVADNTGSSTPQAEEPIIQNTGTSTEMGTSTERSQIGTSTEQIEQNAGTSTQITGSSSSVIETGTTTTASEEQTTGTTTQNIETVQITTTPIHQNSPPQAVIQIQSGAPVAQESTTINFDGRSSYDPDRDNINFLWDMGDGTTAVSANPGPHKYGQPGTYVVTLTVVDEHGARSAAQKIVQVLNAPQITPPMPVAAPAPAPAVTPAPVPLSGTPSPIPAQNQPAQAPAVSNPPVQEKPANPAKTETDTLPANLKMLGYIVLVAENSKLLGKITKTPEPKTAVKTAEKTASKSKTSKKAASGKTAYSNGDLSEDILFTEIFPNPAAGQEEWLEIFNSGESAVNLGNWQLYDKSKKSKPYLIPDTVSLEPNQYAIFKKSETKISLNNSNEEVFLADFRGNQIDSASYEKSIKGSSYSRVNIGGKMSWDWIDTPTPGRENPAFEKIMGVIKNPPAEEAETSFFLIETPEIKKIIFEPSALDPKIASVVLAAGSQVELTAKPQTDGSYILKSIDQVTPAPEKEKQTPEIPIVPWVLAGATGSGFLVKLILKKKLLG